MTSTTSVGASRTSATQMNTERNVARDPNAILSQYKPTGASDRTASQDGLRGGVDASHKMAKNDLARLKKYEAAFESAAKKHGLPPALLAAIASRESRGGAALDRSGHGDGGNGFGLMQVDHRYHSAKGGPYSAQHIDQAAGILKGMLNTVKKNHPDWPAAQQLRGAVAAYNSGTGNVQTIAGMDRGTTGNDYSNDVWARAQALAPHFGGVSGSGGTDKPSGPKPADDVKLPKFDGKYTAAPSLGEVKKGELLHIGHQGESVKDLQKMLGMPAKEQDGYFGPGTREAVYAFQQKHGLKPPAGKEGMVGPTTLEWLKAGGKPPSADKPAPAKPTKPTDSFEPGSKKWTEAPSLNDVKAGKKTLQEGMQGPAVKHLQTLLGIEADGKYGKDTKKAVADFQKSAGLKPPPGSEGHVGQTTLEKLEKAAKGGGVSGPTLGNGVRINTNHPVLKKLGTQHLNNGPTGYCVLTTLNNMKRLGVPGTPAATGMDPNNPRGGMAQMLRNGHWASVPFPGSRQEAIRSPYGNTTANVVSASQYRKLVAEGKVPDGAIIFQSRHGWEYSGGSKGNDMGVVRNNGRTTHNYQSMNSIIYSDCKEVVILVPKDALIRN
jgi:peptidoglycan hydrolase-like protein with peptidoglycan-binding domain